MDESNRRRQEETMYAMACAAGYAADEAQGFEEATRILAERVGASQDEAAEAIRNATQNWMAMADELSEFLYPQTLQDRKEAREDLRAVERETASRFRQYKTGESARAAQRRTGRRRREWRGPWKE